MDSDFNELLKEWRNNVGRPAVYANLDRLFPEYSFRRLQSGTPRDHWASRYKIDLSLPKKRSAEKTVVYVTDYCFREQGDWSNGVDMMDMLMQRRGLSSIADAFAYVDEMFALDMPKRDSKAFHEYASRLQRKRDLLDELAAFFKRELWKNTSRSAGRVRAYLERERGFSQQQSRDAGFGFVPAWDNVIRYFTARGSYSLAELDEACGVRGEDGKTSVGSVYTLAIPYVSAGDVRGFIFRRVGEGTGPKYIASRNLDRKSKFFGIPATLSGSSFIVVEGEFDALKLRSAGFEAVAIGGSDLSGERVQMVRDALNRGVREFVLCLDLDEGADGNPDYGKRYLSTLRCIHAIKEADIAFDRIRIVVFDHCCDPDEYISECGPAVFQRLVDTALPYWKFIEINN